MINSGRFQYFVHYGSGPYFKPVHIGSLSSIIFFTQQKHIDTNKQLCEITKYNQNDEKLVNYNKSYIGVKVTWLFGSTIGNYTRVKVHDSNTVTLCPTELLLCAPPEQTLQRQRLPPLLPGKPI